MNKINKLLQHATLVFTILAITGLTAFAQSTIGIEVAPDYSSTEKRPFDFADKFYYENGVEPNFILNRRTGEDAFSVFDKTDEEKYRNVRIIASSAGYNYKGDSVYFNYYGEVTVDSFIKEDIGKQALKIAERFPIYVFPSQSVEGSDRQAPMFETRNADTKKNPLGLRVIVMVEFTYRIDSDENAQIIADMIERNGVSLDGTPIIKTMDELQELSRREIVTITMKGLDDLVTPSYAIAPIVQDMSEGAIAPDAYLMTVLQEDGKPLKAEEFMVNDFECLKKSGKLCTVD